MAPFGVRQATPARAHVKKIKHVHFHCLSESLRDRTIDRLGIPPVRCHATGYGVDTNYFDTGSRSDAAVIASAGAANRDYVTLAAAVQDLPVSVFIAADSTWVPPAASNGPMNWPANVEADPTDPTHDFENSTLEHNSLCTVASRAPRLWLRRHRRGIAMAAR